MYLITWITTHLPTPEGWMAELAKTRSMQPYIILYKTTLQLGLYLLFSQFTILFSHFRHRQLMVKSMMNKMLVPMLLPLLLLDVAVPVSSVKVSAQVISYRTSRKIQNGPVMCALDVANKTMSSSSLQDCSLTCDHVMLPVLASTSSTHSPVIT